MTLLNIVGTHHLMKKEEIESIIKDYNPEVICVELCPIRIAILVNGLEHLTDKNDETIIGKISNTIKEKAKAEGIDYGSDMNSAARYALNNGIPLVGVDRDIREIQALMQKVPQNEMEGLMSELVAFQEKTLKEQTSNIDENKVLNELRTNYPVAYEFLINSREMHILNQIYQTRFKFPHAKILVFLGKGHIKSIKSKLGIDELNINNIKGGKL